MICDTPRQPIGADQTRVLYIGPYRTICPRPGASPLEILEAVLPTSAGGWADEHGPAITVNSWRAAPRP